MRTALKWALQWALLVAVLLIGCRGSEAAPPSAKTGAAARAALTGERTALPWLKGQLHLHTGNSGDSDTPPADVARWYADHAYDFIVVTDHNVVTEVEGPGQLLVLPGVELTRNLRECEPPPPEGLACLLHMNALIVTPAGRPVWPAQPLPAKDASRAAQYERSMQQGEELGGLVQLNHPNFHRAADAALVTRLAAQGLTLLEVANEAVDSDNEPTGAPSTEALWDAALSQGHRVWGTATDDAHHYEDASAVAARGELAYTGDRGFVMVRSEKTAASIKRALAAGDFYFSNGALLSALDTSGGALHVGAVDGAARIRFVGTGGAVVGAVEGPLARFDLDRLKKGEYVRAVVTDGQGRRAWTQPVWR